MTFLTKTSCWCAGGISSGATGIAEEFHVSSEVTTLCLSLYLLGFAIGPVLLAPLSEYFGRQPVYVVSWFLLFIFQLPLALAPNIGTIIVCRFLAGCAGGAPLTNTGGSISDLWERNSSGGPMAVYGLSSTFGPPTALVMSGYIGLNAGWRWIFWVLMAITGGFWLLLVFTIPETRHSIILQRKAARVRKRMAQENLASAATTVDFHAHARKGLHTLFAITLTRPFRFLFTEPITLCSAIYNGFLYGLVYLFNEAFPLVFGPGTGHGFNTGQQGLSFLGMAIGPIIAFCLYPLQERYYLRRVTANGGKGEPEGTDVDGAVGRAPDPYQSILVRLDELPLRALDCADHRVLVLRRGHLHRDPEYSELRGGQLPDVLGLGAGGGYFCQKCGGGWVPPVREPDVSDAGLRVGV
jgi:multidrug resistance protein